MSNAKELYFAYFSNCLCRNNSEQAKKIEELFKKRARRDGNYGRIRGKALLPLTVAVLRVPVVHAITILTCVLCVCDVLAAEIPLLRRSGAARLAARRAPAAHDAGTKGCSLRVAVNGG